MTKFKFYQDPGHGWVKVPKALLKDIEIDDKISSFSYMRTDWAYLEEDRDLAIFLSAMKTYGKHVYLDESHTNRSSKIRTYDSYFRTWDTSELKKNFEVVCFFAPMVRVVRKRDGKKGFLTFNHNPRYYFDFEEGVQ